MALYPQLTLNGCFAAGIPLQFITIRMLMTQHETLRFNRPLRIAGARSDDPITDSPVPSKGVGTSAL
jgi:hypothetical protein